MAASGGGYGDRKAIEEQAAAAPVPVGGARADAPVPGAGAGAPPPSLFGPTERPNEPITTGATIPGMPDVHGGYAGNNTDMIIEQIIKIWPDPYIMGLLNR